MRRSQPTSKSKRSDSYAQEASKSVVSASESTTARQSSNQTKQRTQLRNQVPSWATSFVLHVIFLAMLAYVTFPLASPPDLSLKATQVVEERLDIQDELPVVEMSFDQDTLTESIDQELDAPPQVEVVLQALELEDVAPLEMIAEPIEFGTAVSDVGELSTFAGMTTTGLEGRSAAGKADLLRRGGGTRSSEKAVLQSLDWIARHQQPDGSWNFDHTGGKCDGRCENPGDYPEARAAATGLALLTYLGAGHTHRDGKYKRVVYDGIAALGKMIKVDKKGGSFWDPKGRMYSQGIATMAICEAYALTRDPRIREAAQAAIDYVCYAQDPRGGGWRYSPRTPGDTSVVGWQIAALKSGYLSELQVPYSVVEKASMFLDEMQTDSGARYLYDQNHTNDRPAVTAIGALCRMYIGTPHDHPGIELAVESLSNRGPRNGDSYYNYYAAQALFHYTGGEGSMWKKWNSKMRSMLVESQENEGHAAGSWTPVANSGDHGRNHGGRLYTTALNTMTLEVYYRMLPIYREKAVTDEFTLQEVD